MLLQSTWKPHLADGGSPSDRLAAALAGDILEGKLETGGRLPPHRDLAFSLSIGVGSVTRAYAVLERRELIRSVKGRGTFVAAVQARSGPLIDLGQNTPPSMLTERVLARTLRQLSQRFDPTILTTYPPPAGHDEHRRLMAGWLADLGVHADAERIVLCNGAQQALALAFALTAQPSDTILTESFTYPGAISLARTSGYRLTAVSMDREGMSPGELDRALTSRGRNKRTVVYVTPTMQNPTAATMSGERRESIVAVCRRHDAWIVEDDVYALAASSKLPALVNLAPERTFYANSLSKTLSPGLRMGALLMPEPIIPAAEAAVRSSGLFVSPLSCAVMAEWLASGVAHSIRASIRDEARRRRALALSILGGAIEEPDHDGFHLWMPMTRSVATQLALAANALGVAVTPPESVAVDLVADMAGIRLCLGGPSLADLSTALIGFGSLVANVQDAAPAGQPIA